MCFVFVFLRTACELIELLFGIVTILNRRFDARSFVYYAIFVVDRIIILINHNNAAIVMEIINTEIINMGNSHRNKRDNEYSVSIPAEKKEKSSG